MELLVSPQLGERERERDRRPRNLSFQIEMDSLYGLIYIHKLSRPLFGCITSFIGRYNKKLVGGVFSALQSNSISSNCERARWRKRERERGRKREEREEVERERYTRKREGR